VGTHRAHDADPGDGLPRREPVGPHQAQRRQRPRRPPPRTPTLQRHRSARRHGLVEDAEEAGGGGGRRQRAAGEGQHVGLQPGPAAAVDVVVVLAGGDDGPDIEGVEHLAEVVGAELAPSEAPLVVESGVVRGRSEAF
jgi:hypothetical protein